MNIIGVKIEDGKINSGHYGQSGASIGWNDFSIGQTNSTFESYYGELIYEEMSYFDFGPSKGKTYFLGFDEAIKTDLNIKDTFWSIFRRAIGW